ncbi:MAG: hypothetical protein HYV63_30620, partial [Candidatus Schekmanbacteria bacterium]|nr:hypothetical protein [Candidatus Schekmanbacteria bacterium]
MELAQANGELRAILARGMMLELYRRGLIELPPVRFVARNNIVWHRRPARMPLLTFSPVPGDLSRVRPLDFRQVRRTGEERFFDSMI